MQVRYEQDPGKTPVLIPPLRQPTREKFSLKGKEMTNLSSLPLDAIFFLYQTQPISVVLNIKFKNILISDAKLKSYFLKIPGTESRQ